MNSALPPESPKLTAATSAFVLAAAITVLFNTALAWAKDAYAPLTRFMTSLTGHHWTTHGLANLLLFVALGFLFTNSKVARKMDPNRLIGILTAAVAIAALGLVLWFAFV
jgi:hypothetical protein